LLSAFQAQSGAATCDTHIVRTVCTPRHESTAVRRHTSRRAVPSIVLLHVRPVFAAFRAAASRRQANCRPQPALPTSCPSRRGVFAVNAGAVTPIGVLVSETVTCCNAAAQACDRDPGPATHSRQPPSDVPEAQTAASKDNFKLDNTSNQSILCMPAVHPKVL
jgi:hypothetical protein